MTNQFITTLTNNFFSTLNSLLESILSQLKDVRRALLLVLGVLLVLDLVTSGSFGFIAYILANVSKIILLVKSAGWQVLLFVVVLIAILRK